MPLYSSYKAVDILQSKTAHLFQSSPTGHEKMLLALLQYYDGEETPLKLNNHGNAKNRGEPYVRTRPSAFQRLKETASSKGMPCL